MEARGRGEAASHVGILAGVDDLALPVHDAVDGDPRDDIGLDELELVYKLRRGPWELGLVIQGREGLLLPLGMLRREGGGEGGADTHVRSSRGSAGSTPQRQAARPGD